MSPAALKRKRRPEQELAEDEVRRLWRSYAGERNAEVRERLIDHYLPFARVMAGKIYAGRHHDDIEFDEYLQFALVGLMESIDRFDPGLGAQFKTYASQRMRGAILDGIETFSERQQQVSFRQRLLAERAQSLKEENKPDANLPDQLFSFLADVGLGLALGYMLEGSGMVEAGDAGSEAGIVASQYDRLEMKQLQQRIRRLLDRLPDRERRVIRYHYLQNIPFQEIAAMCGLTKGRISQVHRNALAILRKEINRMKACDVAW